MDTAKPNLLLIGLRGSGKSTLGRALAARRRVTFIDLDDQTLALLGHKSVADAWGALGEDAFRRAETEALRVALSDTAQVIALGGGTPTAPGAAELIGEARVAGAAIVVYLRCDPEELRSRLASIASTDSSRPSLTGGDPLAEIDEVFRVRDPFYSRLADHVVEGVTTLDEGLDALGRLW